MVVRIRNFRPNDLDCASRKYLREIYDSKGNNEDVFVFFNLTNKSAAWVGLILGLFLVAFSFYAFISAYFDCYSRYFYFKEYWECYWFISASFFLGCCFLFPSIHTLSIRLRKGKYYLGDFSAFDANCYWEVDPILVKVINIADVIEVTHQHYYYKEKYTYTHLKFKTITDESFKITLVGEELVQQAIEFICRNIESRKNNNEELLVNTPIPFGKPASLRDFRCKLNLVTLILAGYLSGYIFPQIAIFLNEENLYQRVVNNLSDDCFLYKYDHKRYMKDYPHGRYIEQVKHYFEIKLQEEKNKEKK